MLAKLSVALAEPVPCGVKVTVNGTLSPAGIVTGNDSPLMLKAELFVLSAVTVTDATLAVRLPDAVPLVPTTTLPTETGLTLSCPAVTTAVPVPVAVPVVGLVSALLVKLRVALAEPVLCGMKVTVNGTLSPAGIVTGNDKPLMVKAELLELAAVTVTGSLLAARLPDPVPLLPTVTLPTEMVLGLTLNWPGGVVTLEPVPESDTLVCASVASLVTVKVALKVPLPFGENAMLIVAA